MKSSTKNSEHYTWGTNCDGWHLLKSDSLSVIQERMPSGTTETMHKHSKSQQYFYILKGIATFIVDEHLLEVQASEGIHIPPNTFHQIQNNHYEELNFLVISEPKSHGDRILK